MTLPYLIVFVAWGIHFTLLIIRRQKRFEHHWLHPAMEIDRHLLISCAAAGMVVHYNSTSGILVTIWLATLVMATAACFHFVLVGTGLRKELVLIRTYREQSRQRRGECTACSYSLVGLADHGSQCVCPECAHENIYQPTQPVPATT